QFVLRNKAGGQPFKTAQTGEPIGTGPTDDVDDAAPGAAGFGADPGALHVDFSDIELVDLGAEVSKSGIGNVGAVNQVGVVLEAAAARRAYPAAVVGDAWQQLEQAAVGAFERQVAQLVGLEVET